MAPPIAHSPPEKEEQGRRVREKGKGTEMSLRSLIPEGEICSRGVVLSRPGNHCTSYVATATYMTPKRFDPEAHHEHYDPYAANMWSLGVTVLEVLMIRYPLLPFG
ncbi:mitogen-activated protein kinase kinase 9-like [Panicum miliaceum]|uniref:Mitogen-activated protein kinase kinase 9-like n=1 Tax=Panicum miliaceum TaxID=4540 RepID=A0A3L6SAN1_PANMI|nr:mitogen-activated protein kinase kinase 9-like [Panicum miliaceum]